ncbi:ABC transporter substrate-binding protein [Polaromonas sp. CG_23.6]|uniref:ABC transporter substrate-binding protein n=1 Tax=Polaromonas sp. CG_23.6 TaxID=2760709 RepID=UPI00247302E8|nr:ABC transporter substrate-binding protein [Polaromonas sp. CG_23.6]MDH6186859.1 branched-chain amino acid transport system substrate-binding protein [Polaromonas sp. CG_23.6]
MKLKSTSVVTAWMLAISSSTLVFPATAQVKVGVINSLSGNFASFGERYKAGMELALKEINENGGINGQKLEIITQDDRSDAQSALAALESLNKDNVSLIIGSYASGITGPLSKVATRQKIPLIVLGSADDSITKPGSPWVFRAKHNSTIVANAYFDYFDDLNKKNNKLTKIAIMHGNGAWPTSIAKEGEAQGKKRGYEIISVQSYDQGTTDFRPILNNFRSADPDILLTSSYADDGIAIARQLKEVGLNPKVVAIDTASSVSSFIKQVGSASENIVSAVSWSPDVKYEGASQLYKNLKASINGEPSFYEAEGYLTLKIAADALRRAKSMDRTVVRDALQKTDMKTPVTDVTFKTYDGFQGQNPIKSLIIQIQNGEHVTVYPGNLGSKQPRLNK